MLTLQPNYSKNNASKFVYFYEQIFISEISQL
jgi:hypothetical protein